MFWKSELAWSFKLPPGGDSVLGSFLSRRTFTSHDFRGWYLRHQTLNGGCGSTGCFVQVSMFPVVPMGTVTAPEPKAAVASETLWVEWWLQLGGIWSQACWLPCLHTQSVPSLRAIWPFVLGLCSTQHFSYFIKVAKKHNDNYVIWNWDWFLFLFIFY